MESNERFRLTVNTLLALLWTWCVFGCALLVAIALKQFPDTHGEAIMRSTVFCSGLAFMIDARRRWVLKLPVGKEKYSQRQLTFYEEGWSSRVKSGGVLGFIFCILAIIPIPGYH